MIKGQKDKFAIEYKFIGKRMGYIRFWINNQSIGNWEETFILPNILSLERVANYSTFKELDIGVEEPNSILERILLNEDLYSNTLIGLGETFDSNIFRCYFYDTRVVFLWTKNVNNISNNIFWGITDRIFFINLVKEIKNEMLLHS
jgi:hypothetical protein